MKLFYFILFLIFSLSAVAKNEVFYYEPKMVELTGIVKRMVFSGAPDFSRIENIGDVESGRCLILKNPIDVDLQPNAEVMNIDEPEKNVKILQLTAGRDSEWKKIKNNARVRVKGVLFRPELGHPHTRVLLEAQKVTVLPAKKISEDELTMSPEDWQFINGDGENKEP